MAIHDNIAELRKCRDELMQIDFGYPLGDNEVFPRTTSDPLSAALHRIASDDTREQLAALYSECDGFSLPDVHIGYFVKPRAKLESFDRSSEPDTLLLDSTLNVLPLGSTGGGGLFVVESQAGNVLLIPPGPLHDGRYDGTNLDVREVGSSVEHFMERLTADVRAFIKGTKHTYLA